MKSTKVVRHPLIETSLTVLRAKSTTTQDFRMHAKIVSQIIFAEAIKSLQTHDVSVETPLTTARGKELALPVVAIPVLRAGLAMYISVESLLPNMLVGMIGEERDEQTAIARNYYAKLPAITADSPIFILDPMLATGGSADAAIARVKEKGGTNIHLVTIISAPEGIKRVSEKYPEVPIFTGVIDSHLNEQKYIVPGLGDFGDRYFGT